MSTLVPPPAYLLRTLVSFCRSPMKAVTNEEREQRRQENLAQARAFRKRGEKDKAFEKYKACIRVSSGHAAAVAERVRRAFAADPSVQVVESPYEADAQLVQLVLEGAAEAVITEDSDVLVYQAACRVAFPVLFKLDRHSGSCDVLSMDWLFSGGSASPGGGAGASAPWTTAQQRDDPQNGKSKKPAAFDAILQALADREGRDPGLGSRLFVQSCVLAGCDYSPNLLAGVGLVGAFRHVRESVHVPDGDRFRHVLGRLPARARRGIAAGKIGYEELLAKSEAVFYRHIVRLRGGDTGGDSGSGAGRGMLAFLGDGAPPPPSSAVAAGGRHRPDMGRFGGDWTFLGDVACGDDGRAVPVEPSGSGSDRDKARRPAFPQTGALGVEKKASAPAVAKRALQVVHNPYAAADRGLNGRKRPVQQPHHQPQAQPSSSPAARRSREPLAPLFAAGNGAGGPPNRQRSEAARGHCPNQPFSKYFFTATRKSPKKNASRERNGGDNSRMDMRPALDYNPRVQEGPCCRAYANEPPRDDASEVGSVAEDRPEAVEDAAPVDPFLSKCKMYKGDPRFVRPKSLDRPQAGSDARRAAHEQGRAPSPGSLAFKAGDERRHLPGSRSPPSYGQVAVENDPGQGPRQDEAVGTDGALLSGPARADDGDCERNHSIAFTYHSSLSASVATYDASDPHSRSVASKGSGLAPSIPLPVHPAWQPSRRPLDPFLFGNAEMGSRLHSLEVDSASNARGQQSHHYAVDLPPEGPTAGDWPCRSTRPGNSVDYPGDGGDMRDPDPQQSDFLAGVRQDTNAPLFAEPPHVSLDSADLAVPPPSDPSSPSPTRSARPFQYYDEDFMCSPDPANFPANQDLLADDIVDEPSPPPGQGSLPTSNLIGDPSLVSQSRFFTSVPLSTIGPAKTVRPALHAAHRSHLPRQDVGLKRFLPQLRDDGPNQSVGLKRFLPQKPAHGNGAPQQHLGLKRFLPQRLSGAANKGRPFTAATGTSRSPKRRRRASSGSSPHTSATYGSSRPISHYFAQR
jgi:hypothetical protein